MKPSILLLVVLLVLSVGGNAFLVYLVANSYAVGVERGQYCQGIYFLAQIKNRGIATPPMNESFQQCIEGGR